MTHVFSTYAAIPKTGQFSGEYRELFDTIQTVSYKTFTDALAENGINFRTDPRLKEVYDYLEQTGMDREVGKAEFIFTVNVVSSQSKLIDNTTRNKLVIRNWRTVRDVVDEIHKKLMNDTRGLNAQYIPMLRDADSSKWAISICSVDGQRYDVGDYKEKFSIQSMSKPFTYGATLEAF